MLLDWYDISKMDKNKDFKAISGYLASIQKHSLKIGHELFETFCKNHKEKIKLMYHNTFKDIEIELNSSNDKELVLDW